MRRYLHPGETLSLKLRVHETEIEVEVDVESITPPSDGILGRNPGGAHLAASARWKVTEWQEFSLR